MKRVMWIAILILGMALSGNLFAQNSRYSAGIVGTWFQNYQDNHRLTEINNPVGSGLVLAYQVNDQVGFALTQEYFTGSMQRFAGTESDWRTHFAAFLFPLKIRRIKPYLSAGLVYTHQKLDYDNAPVETDTWFNGRMAIGMDYPVARRLHLNLDLSFYTDGWDFVGWGNTVGLRYSF